MNIEIITFTKGNEINLGGKLAGICYMPDNFEKLKNEDIKKTINRAKRTMESGHHSVFEHYYFTLYLENIPKLFAMLLNNEKVYTTSEKSARYTKMELNGKQKQIYDKWVEKLCILIENKYGNQPYFDEKRIKKLAMENARYFTSVMTPTSMAYTVSFRQLNYLCGWLKEFETSTNPIYKMLSPYASEFVEIISAEDLLYTELMNDGKNREFSLIGKRVREEQFGECYSVNYLASYACLAQAQRHRTLHYEMMPLEHKEFYIPHILTEDTKLIKEWLRDMWDVAEFTPQGEMLLVNERGDYENLILKAKERLCTSAQLEVMRNTKDTIEKIIKNTNNDYVKKDLEKINCGARCTSGYKCSTPCAFKEGIDLSRII